MYNKIISLLILIVIFGGIYYFFYYFFVLNKGNLTITSNVSDYKVIMYTDKIKTSFSTECKKQICELIDLAPFDYEITIEKKGYKNYKKNIKVDAKTTLKLNIKLEKQISIKKIISEDKDLKKEDIANSSKINRFREISSLQKSYKYFNLGEYGYFYFVKNDDNTITLFNKKVDTENKILSFDNISSDKLDIQKIYGSNNLILIVYGDDKNIYNLDTGKLDKIFFPQKVNYIKTSLDLFYFINDKGTFIYDSKTTKIDYFYAFRDFIIYDDENYFGIIYKDEIEKIKNYNLENYKDINLIVKYNFITKNIKVLGTTKDSISKIVFENNNIYFYNNLGDKYLVDNIE